MVVIDCYITNHCKTLWIKATIIYLFTVVSISNLGWTQLGSSASLTDIPYVVVVI